jgi:hypothetical protein
MMTRTGHGDRAAPGDHQRGSPVYGQGGDRGDERIDPHVADEQPVHNAHGAAGKHADRQSQGDTARLPEAQDPQDSGKGDDRPYGQVQPSRDDDESHADGQHGQGRAMDDYVDEVLRAEKEWGRKREDNDQKDRDPDERDQLAPGTDCLPEGIHHHPV